MKDGLLPIAGEKSGLVAPGAAVRSHLNSRTVPEGPWSQYTILGTRCRASMSRPKGRDSFSMSSMCACPGCCTEKWFNRRLWSQGMVSVDKSSLAGLPGKPQVVAANDFVGVVADTQWNATQAAAALELTGSDPATLPDQATLYTWMQQAASADSYTVNSGRYRSDAQRGGHKGERSISASVPDARSASQFLRGRRRAGRKRRRRHGEDLVGHARRLSAARQCGDGSGNSSANVRAIFVEGSGCYGLNGND